MSFQALLVVLNMGNGLCPWAEPLGRAISKAAP